MSHPPSPPTSPAPLIAKMREHAHLTQAELAKRARVSPSYLSKVESGATIPTNHWLGIVTGVIAEALRSSAVLPAAQPA